MIENLLSFFCVQQIKYRVHTYCSLHDDNGANQQKYYKVFLFLYSTTSRFLILASLTKYVSSEE